MSIHILGRGIYVPSEVGRLTGLSAQQVRRWLLGGGGRQPVTHGDYRTPRPGPVLLSFLDLIDIVVLGRLRGAGVSLQYLRKAREELVHEFDTQHPFCHREILTDGRKVFIHVADELGEDEILKELISKQQAFPKVLLPLLAQVAYDRGSALARSWRIRPGIVIDPGRQYGKPIVSAAAIPTAVLAAAYYANARRTRIVADAYGIRPQHVRLAVGFEREFAGVAA